MWPWSRHHSRTVPSLSASPSSKEGCARMTATVAGFSEVGAWCAETIGGSFEKQPGLRHTWALNNVLVFRKRSLERGKGRQPAVRIARVFFSFRVLFLSSTASTCHEKRISPTFELPYR